MLLLAELSKILKNNKHILTQGKSAAILLVLKKTYNQHFIVF